MRYPTILLMLTIISLIGGCSKKNYSNSAALDNQIIDGDAGEWVGRMAVTNAQTGLQVGVSNDKENLYLCIRSTKEQTNTKILMGGMELWIDPSGKGKKTFGIKYPLGAAASHNKRPRGDQQHRPDFKTMLETLASEVQFVGFLPPNTGRMEISSSNDVELKIGGKGRSELIYEVKIPFRTFLGDESPEQIGNRDFAYAIVVKGLIKPNETQGGAPAGGGGRRPGGGGGRSSGGRGFSQDTQPGQAPANAGQTELFTNYKVSFISRLTF